MHFLGTRNSLQSVYYFNQMFCGVLSQVSGFSVLIDGFIVFHFCATHFRVMASSELLSVESCGKKIFMLLYRCHQILSGFLAKGHFPRVSYQSRLSANDKDDSKMISGAEHRSPGICLIAEENPRKI